MATIKAFSDLEQSRKLAEILPLESADMCWEVIYASPKDDMIEYADKPTIGYIKHCLPAWSLAALLSVFPKYELNNFGNAIQLGVNRDAFETEGDETLLDLVVNAIIYLHEHKKL